MLTALLIMQFWGFPLLIQYDGQLQVAVRRSPPITLLYFYGFNLTRKVRLPKLKIPPRVVNARNHKKFDLKAFQLDIQHITIDIIKTVSKDVNDIWLRSKHSF